MAYSILFQLSLYSVFIIKVINNEVGSMSLNPPKLEVLSSDFNENDCKINSGKRCADIEKGATIHLKCNGSKPLIWSYPQNHIEDSENIKNLASIVDHCEILNNSTELCTTEFILPNTSYQHTGQYSCVYEHLIYESVDSMDSIYVFVNDDNNLLVPFEGSTFIMISVLLFQPATIPCLPTNSRVTVTLINPQTSIEIAAHKNSDIEYDPTLGFYFKRPDWKENFFTCEANFLNKTESIPVSIHVALGTLSSITPKIIQDENNLLVVNGSFTLKCTVEIEYGILILMMWSHPITDSSRVFNYPESTQIIRTEKGQKEIVTKTMTVVNLKKEDDGVYYCNVSDISGQINSTNIFMEIRDPYADSKGEIDNSKSNKPYGRTIHFLITIAILILAIFLGVVAVVVYRCIHRSANVEVTVTVQFTNVDSTVAS